MNSRKNNHTKQQGFRLRNALLWMLVSCVVLGLATGCKPEQPTGSSSSQITTTPPTTAPTTNPTTGPTTGPDIGNDGDDMVKYSDVVARLYDIKWQARRDNQGETSYQWSTSDRASVYNEETGLYENWDANNDGGFKVRDENNNSLTIDIQGSGYVSRLWFASVYVQGMIHIIVDGHTVVSMDLMEYMVGVNSNNYNNDVEFIDSKDKNFFSEHTYSKLSYLSSKGYNSFIPITFSESIQIMFSNVTAESGYDAASFKQIDYTLFDDNRQVESFTGFDNLSAESVAALEKANSSFDFAVPMNGSAISLAAGERKEVYNNQKPGAIHMIKMQLPDVELDDLPAVLRQLYIQMNWDGQDTPAVLMNMGDFFGSPAEIKTYQTLNVGVTEENVFYLQFYMPFEKASISFLNRSDKDLSVKAELVVEDITQKEAEETMRFCASWKKLEDRAVTSDRWPECTTLTLQGSGRLVGQIWHTYQVLEGFWWGEGDERIYVDGEKMPSWAGTGCEDVIGYAWAIPTSWVFSAPFRAHPVGAGSSSAIGDKVNVLMFSASAPTFDTSLEMSLEKYFSDEYCFVSAISYYYLDSTDVEANGKGEYSAAERSACAPLPEVGPEVPAVYRYEGELINGFVEITSGIKYGQWLGAGWSGRGQLCWFNCGDGSDNAELSFPIRVEKSGNYNIRIAYTTAIDFVTVDVYLDDEKIQENVNLFSYGISRSVHELGLRHIEAGEHTVKFVVVGKDYRCVPNNSKLSDGVHPRDELYNSVFLDALLKSGCVLENDGAAAVFDVTNAVKEIPAGVLYNWDSFGADSAKYWAKQYAQLGKDGVTTLFLGDSFFDIAFWDQFYVDLDGQEAMIAGIGGSTASDWINYMDRDLFLNGIAPKNIVINIGNNDIFNDFLGAETAVQNIRKMVQMIHERMPETKVYLFSVTARSNAMSNDNTRADVTNTNAAMKQWCDDPAQDWITFVDISSQMAGADSYVFGFDYFEIEPENFHRINSSDILSLEMLKSGGYFVSETHESSACSSTDFLTFYNTEGEVAFEIDFAHSGNYTLEMSFVKANSFGIVQVYLDDVLIGTAVDLYHNGLKTTGNLEFGTMDITKGTHKLSFKTPTKNEESLGHLFAIDHIDIITNSITEDPAETDQKNQRYEAENLIPYVSCENGGDYWHQNAWDIGNPALSAKGQLVWINNQVGSVMTIPFNVHQTGHYELRTKFFKAVDFAQFDVYVDDVKVVTGYDCYNDSMALGDVVALGEFDLTEGTHTIKIVITGKNEASTGYVFAMDYIDMDYTTEENNTRIEIEDLHEQIRIENGELWKKEQNSLYSNFYQEFYWHNSKNDYMEFDFTVEEDADYDFRGVFCVSYDFGIVQFYVDGHKLGDPIDLYQGIEGISARLFIGNYALKAGQHTLRVVAVDKNRASSAYAIGIDFIDIIRVGPWHEEAPDVPDVPDEPQKPEIPENATVRRYEAENLLPYLQCVNGGGYWHQNAWDIGNPPLSGQAQLVWIDNQVGSTLTCPFNVHHAGEYFLFTKFCKAGDFATFNLYVDDVLVLENYDCFDGALCLTDEEYLGKYVFAEGTHNIKIEVTGKNALSTGYVFAMDYIEMRYTTEEDYTRVEVESLDGQIGIAGGRLWAQPKGSVYSDGHMELLLENGLNDYMEFAFSVAEDGSYDILGVFCQAADFGIVQFYVDGQKLGAPVDFYNPSERITARMLLGNISLKAGEHTFKAVAVGKQEASFGYLIGIDFIDIRRAGEYVDSNAPVVHPLDYEMEHFGDVVVIENANRPFYQGMGPEFSGSAQLCWVANQGAVMVIPFQVEHDGEYSLVTQFCKAGDFAIFDLYVDGVKVLDSYDGYSSYLTPSGAVDLGKFQFSKGEHTIRIELTGKSDVSTGYVFAIDYLKMEFTTQDVFHRIEVESLDGSVRIQGGRLWAQPKNSMFYSNGHMELLLENGQNDYMEFDFTVDEAGNYDLFGAFCKAADFGIVQIYVDGVALGDPIDFYSEWETVSGRLLLGNLHLEAGRHTIKLLVIGKQDVSFGYLVGMDYLELVPKEE